MTLFLGLTEDENVLCDELGAVIRWMRMRRLDFIVCKTVPGVYRVILIKEKGLDGGSLGALTYKKLMEKVNAITETRPCCV